MNALVIDGPTPRSESGKDPRRYFEENVIHGLGSFSMMARSYEDYGRAMEKKLIREIVPTVIGRAHSLENRQVLEK